MGPLCTLVDFVDIQDTQLTLKDVRSLNSWDLNKLATMMPQDVRDEILNTHVHIRDDVPDVLVWDDSVHGTYTARDGYMWLLKQRDVTPNACAWGWIWNKKGPENIKFLFWLACHDSAPTNITLYHRGILHNSCCQRCMLGEETFLHSIRDCPSSSLWEAFGFRDAAFYQNMEMSSWMKNETYDMKGNLFIAVLWWSWRVRNTHSIGKEVTPPYKVWIAGFDGFSGHSNNLHAELLAILNGLSIGWSRGIRNLICYLDSLNAINMVEETIYPMHKYAPIIMDIREFLGKNWTVKICHTLREGNASADYMAKHGASIDDHLTIFETPQ